MNIANVMILGIVFVSIGATFWLWTLATRWGHHNKLKNISTYPLSSQAFEEQQNIEHKEADNNNT